MSRKCISGKNFIKYLQRNMTRVLLLAVLLSTGLTMHFVTRAKYISYVNTENHAVAGKFYFTCNYLQPEEENIVYEISNWKRNEYAIDLRIHNFENSMLYNEGGCYYHVEAIMYKNKDAGGKYTNVDADFTAEIEYKGAGDNIVEFNGKKYAYLPGIKATDLAADKSVKDLGTQLVTVKLTAKNGDKVTEERFLEVKAYTMTVPEMKQALADQIISNLPEGAVFDTRLAAKFHLMSQSDADVSVSLKQTEYDSTKPVGQQNLNSEALCEIRCINTDGGAYSRVRIYYDTEQVKFEDAYKFTNVTDVTGTTYKCFELEVYSTSIQKLMFFKRRMTDNLTTGAYTVANGLAGKHAIYYEVIKNTQQ